MKREDKAGIGEGDRCSDGLCIGIRIIILVVKCDFLPIKIVFSFSLSSSSSSL